jgi:hypothetical protein
VFFLEGVCVFFISFFVLFFKTESCYVAQTVLELVTLLPLEC